MNQGSNFGMNQGSNYSGGGGSNYGNMGQQQQQQQQQMTPQMMQQMMQMQQMQMMQRMAAQQQAAGQGGQAGNPQMQQMMGGQQMTPQMMQQMQMMQMAKMQQMQQMMAANAKAQAELQQQNAGGMNPMQKMKSMPNSTGAAQGGGKKGKKNKKNKKNKKKNQQQQQQQQNQQIQSQNTLPLMNNTTALHDNNSNSNSTGNLASSPKPSFKKMQSMPNLARNNSGSKAAQQQMMQLQKMQKMLAEQKQANLGTGFSARIDTIISHENMYVDSKMIVRALFLFGCSPSKSQKHKYIVDIMTNFKKQKINDEVILTGMVRLMAPETKKLFKKLIPDVKIRDKFLSWIRYDIYQLTVHSNPNGLDYVPPAQKEAAAMDMVVNFNLRGRMYSALRSTLLRTSSSYFKKLLKANAKSRVMDSNGAYFIERRGELFAVVLRYLRSTEVRFDAKQFTLQEIQLEFKFYDVSFPSKTLNSLPNEFRFEYCCMYNQLMQFFAGQFRVLPKKAAKGVAKYVDIPNGDVRDPQLFFALKDEMVKLGFQLCETHKYRGDPQQWVWTNVEIYRRNVWSLTIKNAAKQKKNH